MNDECRAWCRASRSAFIVHHLSFIIPPHTSLIPHPSNIFIFMLDVNVWQWVVVISSSLLMFMIFPFFFWSVASEFWCTIDIGCSLRTTIFEKQMVFHTLFFYYQTHWNSFLFFKKRVKRYLLLKGPSNMPPMVCIVIVLYCHSFLFLCWLSNCVDL